MHPLFLPPLVFIRDNVSVFQDLQSHPQTPFKSGKATMVVGINSSVVTHKIICGRDSVNIFERKFWYVFFIKIYMHTPFHLKCLRKTLFCFFIIHNLE